MDFDRLLDDVYPGLVRYGQRISADPGLAEDAAQEAFVRYLDREPRGDAATLRAWLYRVTTLGLRERSRTEEGRRRGAGPMEPGRVPLRRATGGVSIGGSEGPPPPASAPAGAFDLLEALGRDARIACVQAALQELDIRDRTLLLLREEGFSYRELAEAAGVQGSAVGPLLARARRRLGEAVLHRAAASPPAPRPRP